MLKKALFPIVICVSLLASLPAFSDAAANLPVRTQMVLIKISPLFEGGEYAKAIQILKEFQAKKKGEKDTTYDHAEINFALGNCHMLLDQLQEARHYYLRTVERDPKHTYGWQNLAKAEYELENFMSASKAFYRSYELSGENDARLLYYTAVTRLLAGRLDDCLRYFTTLFAKHPDTILLQWKESLVQALIQADKPREALPYMIELAEGYTGKKQQRWQELLLQQYLSLEMRQKALELAQRLTRNQPTYATWWKALAHVWLQQERYDKAVAALTVYSYLTPLQKDEEKLLADLYMQQGVPQKAVIRYENFTKLEEDEQAQEALIRAYLTLGRTEHALEKLKTFGDTFPEQKRAMLQGEICYMLKDYAEAAIFYKRAAKSKGKESPRGYLMAAYSYWQLGNTLAAEENFQEAAKTKRYKKEAEKAIIQLASLGRNEKN
jgi:tetratricopeptide (TPR) repeat protein